MTTFNTTVCPNGSTKCSSHNWLETIGSLDTSDGNQFDKISRDSDIYRSQGFKATEMTLCNVGMPKYIANRPYILVLLKIQMKSTSGELIKRTAFVKKFAVIDDIGHETNFDNYYHQWCNHSVSCNGFNSNRSPYVGALSDRGKSCNNQMSSIDKPHPDQHRQATPRNKPFRLG